MHFLILLNHLEFFFAKSKQLILRRLIFLLKSTKNKKKLLVLYAAFYLIAFFEKVCLYISKSRNSDILLLSKIHACRYIYSQISRQLLIYTRCVQHLPRFIMPQTDICFTCTCICVYMYPSVHLCMRNAITFYRSDSRDYIVVISRHRR